MLSNTDLNQYANTVPPTTKSPHQASSTKSPKLLHLTVPFVDVIERFKKAAGESSLSKIKTEDAEDEFTKLTTQKHSFVLSGCAMSGDSDCNPYVYCINGRLGVKCQHNKCSQRTIFDLLSAYGIKPSELSTFYPDDASPVFINLVNVLVNKIDSVHGKDIFLKGGDIINVKDAGTSFATTTIKGNPCTLPLAKWAEKSCPELLRAANSWPSDEKQMLPQRLAREVAKLAKAVVMDNVIYSFTGSGYALQENEEQWCASEIRKVVDADTEKLRSFGLDAPQPPITVSDSKNCLLNLRCSLPLVKEIGTDLTGQVDLKYSVNYRNGIYLPKVNELIPHSPNYFVRPAMEIDFVAAGPMPHFEKFIASSSPLKKG